MCTKKCFFALSILLFLFSLSNTAKSQTISKLPDEFEAPYQLYGNDFYVTAELNGKLVNFMLDTGAPTLMIDPKYLSDTANPATVKIDSFSWHGINWKNFNAQCISLGGNTVPTNRPCAGLIGYEVFKEYELIFDCPNKRIIFLRTDSLGQLVSKFPLDKKPILIKAIEMQQHSPIFELTIDGKVYKLILDSGGCIGFLNPKASGFIKDTVNVPDFTLPDGGSLGKNVFLVKNSSVDSINFKNLPFVYASYVNFSKEKPAPVGLVGYDFFKQYIIAINYKKREMYIYE